MAWFQRVQLSHFISNSLGASAAQTLRGRCGSLKVSADNNDKDCDTNGLNRNYGDKACWDNDNEPVCKSLCEHSCSLYVPLPIPTKVTVNEAAISLATPASISNPLVNLDPTESSLLNLSQKVKSGRESGLHLLLFVPQSPPQDSCCMSVSLKWWPLGNELLHSW